VSAGQLGPVPVHVSATSHASAEGRQVVADAANASAGHAPAPSLLSATSHDPDAVRQTVVLGAWFAWHVPLASQVSGDEQTVLL
jgi:hypothetical protein